MHWRYIILATVLVAGNGCSTPNRFADGGYRLSPSDAFIMLETYLEDNPDSVRYDLDGVRVLEHQHYFFLKVPVLERPGDSVVFEVRQPGIVRWPLPTPSPEVSSAPLFGSVEITEIRRITELALDTMPRLVDGTDTLESRIVYPSTARKASVEGELEATLTVGADGTPVDVEVTKKLGAGIDEEVSRVLRAAKFHAGKHRGKSVDVRIAIAIRFELNHYRK